MIRQPDNNRGLDQYAKRALESVALKLVDNPVMQGANRFVRQVFESYKKIEDRVFAPYENLTKEDARIADIILREQFNNSFTNRF